MLILHLNINMSCLCIAYILTFRKWDGGKTASKTRNFTKPLCFICNNYIQSKKRLYLEIPMSSAAACSWALSSWQQVVNSDGRVKRLVCFKYPHSPRYRKSAILCADIFWGEWYSHFATSIELLNISELMGILRTDGSILHYQHVEPL